MVTVDVASLCPHFSSSGLDKVVVAPPAGYGGLDDKGLLLLWRSHLTLGNAAEMTGSGGLVSPSPCLPASSV